MQGIRMVRICSECMLAASLRVEQSTGHHMSEAGFNQRRDTAAGAAKERLSFFRPSPMLGTVHLRVSNLIRQLHA
jgi:hypothetical protein